MKLLLFIIGLTLCASWPAFRTLSEENNEENCFLEFTDLELGEYFGDADHDLFDLTFHLNEEGEVDTHLGEENNEEFFPTDPSDVPTEPETPEEPTEETPEEPTEPETPEEPVEETPEEPTEETPEEPTEETPEEPTEETPEEPTEETPEEPTEETPEEPSEEEEELPTDLLSQVRGDAEANNAFNFGVSAIIAKGIQDNKIPNENFNVLAVSVFSKTSNTNGNLYKFSCVAVNANGSSVINMNLTVHYQLSNQRRTLSSYSYNIKTNIVNTPVTDYAQIEDAEINTAFVQSILNFGASQIYTIGSQDGKIPVSVFAITNVVSVWKQLTTLGTNYRCQVVLEDNNKVTINANFTVYYKTSTQQNTLSQYSYNVKTSSSNNNNTNTTTPTNPTNNTNTTTDPYTALTQEEIANSAEVQAALNYGGNYTIQQGNAKNKIPVSIYTITKVLSVGKQAISGGRTAYKCSVEINDPRGILVKAQYVVNVRASNQQLSVSTWAYQIFNLRYADDPFPTTNTTNTTNNNNNTNNTNTGGNTTQPTDNNNTNTNTTTPNTNNTNTTTPTNPTNNTNTTTDPFTALSQEEIASSAEVQGALNYGANQTLLYGYAKNRIPVSTYTITKINSVGRQAISNGRNSYKCDIELQDVNKVLVKAQFVVNVKVSTQDKSISTWAYQVSNVKK